MLHFVLTVMCRSRMVRTLLPKPRALRIRGPLRLRQRGRIRRKLRYALPNPLLALFTYQVFPQSLRPHNLRPPNPNLRLLRPAHQHNLRLLLLVCQHRPLHLCRVFLRHGPRPLGSSSEDAILCWRHALFVLCHGLVFADCEFVGGAGVWGFVACGGFE